MVPTFGDIITACGSQDVLGINDTDTIRDYVQRAIELVEYEANWDSYLQTIDICSDGCGYVTLPDFVESVLATNVGGFPAYFRNSWFEYHINGPGSLQGPAGVPLPGGIGMECGWCWDDRGMSPILQQLNGWTVLAAIVEDPIDGNGSLQLQVFGETMDPYGNTKDVLTIPVSGPSNPGVFVPLLINSAATDPQATPFRKITRVIKPVTRGYVKLLGIPLSSIQNASATPYTSGPLLGTAPGVTLGYYGPNDIQPSYRRIKVTAACQWVRMKCRLKSIPLNYSTDLIPIPSKQAMIYLIKSLRMDETNNSQEADRYKAKALDILFKKQQIADGPATFAWQVDPSFGLGCVDLR